MKLGKNINVKVGLGLLIAVIVGLTIFAFTIPRDYHYEKSADIIAQQRMVFVFIGELKRWVEWTKWHARNPETKYEYSEPSWGVGASYKWKTWPMEAGTVTVTQFTRDASMVYDLAHDGWELSHWQFHLGPAARQGTTVTWTVDGQYPENRFWRLVAYVMMWRLPSDMQKGLLRLKKHAELHEAYDVKGGWEP